MLPHARFPCPCTLSPKPPHTHTHTHSGYPGQPDLSEVAASSAEDALSARVSAASSEVEAAQVRREGAAALMLLCGYCCLHGPCMGLHGAPMHRELGHAGKVCKPT